MLEDLSDKDHHQRSRAAQKEMVMAYMNMRNLYEQVNDENIHKTALALIETVDDAKYKKKYQRIWK